MHAHSTGPARTYRCRRSLRCLIILAYSTGHVQRSPLCRRGWLVSQLDLIEYLYVLRDGEPQLFEQAYGRCVGCADLRDKAGRGHVKLVRSVGQAGVISASRLLPSQSRPTTAVRRPRRGLFFYLPRLQVSEHLIGRAIVSHAIMISHSASPSSPSGTKRFTSPIIRRESGLVAVESSELLGRTSMMNVNSVLVRFHNVAQECHRLSSSICHLPGRVT